LLLLAGLLECLTEIARILSRPTYLLLIERLNEWPESEKQHAG
jgi:hypothetical protein